VIFGAVTVGVVTLMAVSGVLILPVVSGTGILPINGSLQVLSTLVPVCVGLGVVLLEYTGSCLLLTYSFQES